MISGKDFEKIKNELERTLDDVLQNNPDLSQARDVKTIVDWFRKIKRERIEPGTILGMISRHIVSKLFESLPIELSNTLEDKLRGFTVQHSQSGTGVNAFLPGFQTSADVVFVANGTLDLGKVTVGLLQDIGVTLDGIKPSSKGGGKRFEIGRIGFSINVYLFTKMMIGMKRKKIAQKEFELKDIVLAMA